MKLFFAAPASFLPSLSTALVVQSSRLHFFMKLVFAAPTSALPSLPTALLSQLSPCANAVAMAKDAITATTNILITSASMNDDPHAHASHLTIANSDIVRNADFSLARHRRRHGGHVFRHDIWRHARSLMRSTRAVASRRIRGLGLLAGPWASNPVMGVRFSQSAPSCFALTRFAGLLPLCPRSRMPFEASAKKGKFECTPPSSNG